MGIFKMTFFSSAEVSKHNSEQDCWTIIDGKVYDLTAYMHDHPGGKACIVEYAGTDSSRAFDLAEHSKAALKDMKKYEIGTLGMQPVAAVANSEPMSVIQKKPEQNNLIKEPEYQPVPMILTILIFLSGVFSIFLACAWLLHSEYGIRPDLKWAGGGDGKWHYILTTIFSVFTGFGCLVFRIFPHMSKQMKLWLHSICIIIGFIAGTAGIADKYISRVDLNKIHMFSLHSWIGLVFFFAYCAQMFTGVIFFLRPFIILPGKYRKSAIYWHILAGFIIFAVIQLSSFSGVVEKEYSVSKQAAKHPDDLKSVYQANVSRWLGGLIMTFGVLVGTVLVNEVWNPKGKSINRYKAERNSQTDL